MDEGWGPVLAALSALGAEEAAATAATLLGRAAHPAYAREGAALERALRDVGASPERVLASPRHLGIFLRHLCGRAAGGRRLVARGATRNGSALWRVDAEQSTPTPTGTVAGA